MVAIELLFEYDQNILSFWEISFHIHWMHFTKWKYDQNGIVFGLKHLRG